MRLTKNVKTILTITVAAVALYALNYLLVGQTYIPQNFIDARASASKSADELMTILTGSQATLDQIAQNDQSYHFLQAQELVRKEIASTTKSFEKAQELAGELNDMSNAAEGITPSSARTLAHDAMQQEVSLIGKLIIYNQSFNSLLQNLSLKFSGSIKYNSDEVQKQIAIMNSAAGDINDLNALFNRKMSEFDKMTK